MAKSQGDLLRELSDTVATLVERVHNARAEIVRVDTAHTKTAETLAEVSKQAAVMAERLGELKKNLEESSRRRWLIVAALVGSLLTFLGNLVLLFWRR